MITVLALCLVSCGKSSADNDVIATAEPTMEVTNAPTDEPTQAPPTEEPTPELTQIPADVRIMREEPEPLKEAYTGTQEGIYFQWNLFDALNDPQYADALFEVALSVGMVSTDETSVEELERELQEEADWLNQHGYNAKWYLRYEDEPGYPGYRRCFFYGYFTPEQLLNFPDSDEYGYSIDLLRYYANAYDIPLDELDIWE